MYLQLIIIKTKYLLARQICDMHKCVIEACKDVSYTKHIFPLFHLRSKCDLFFSLLSLPFSGSHSEEEKRLFQTSHKTCGNSANTTLHIVLFNQWFIPEYQCKDQANSKSSNVQVCINCFNNKPFNNQNSVCKNYNLKLNLTGFGYVTSVPAPTDMERIISYK